MEIKDQLPFSQLYLANLGNLIILKTLRLFTPQHTRFISKDCRVIVDYLNEHYREEINLDTLAKQIFLSKHYLSHIFKAEMGISPIKYLTLKRIEESKRLLKETHYSITKIAELVGYPNAIYFGQFFKKVVELSPSEYRQSVRTESDRKSKE